MQIKLSNNQIGNFVRLVAVVVMLAQLFGFQSIDNVYASGKRLYVKSSGLTSGLCDSWSNACGLQHVLGLATSNDEIWVAAGRYYPTIGMDPNISFLLVNGVSIYGGFNGTEIGLSQRDPYVNVTVLSGDIGIIGDSSDNSYHVVRGNGTDNSAVLDGFTITGGRAIGDTSKPYGGGMFNENSSPTLSNLVIKGNSALYGGGMLNMNSSLTLSNTVLSDNIATRGGGIYNTLNSNLVLTNVTISGNYATTRGGGMINSGSNPHLTNVTFSGNTAALGGGIHNVSSNPILINVTLSSNSASTAGGGIYNFDNSIPTITNSIVYGNFGGAIHDVGSASVVTYSVVEGGYSGAGNLSTDPLLGSLYDNGGATQTMALQFGSSAIDAGNDSICPATDQRGLLRPRGNHCDMGSFEFNPGIHYVNDDASGANNGSSWSAAYTDLQSAISTASAGDEIWVATGTYKPTTGTDRTISFALKNGVAVYGGFAGNEKLFIERNFQTNITILSGDIGIENDASDNSYHVVTGDGTDNTAILNGFTITEGNANDASDSDILGGGMHILLGSPSLSNLIFMENAAKSGGGIALDNSNSTLENLTFQSNSAETAGGMLIIAGIPTLKSLTFSENTVAFNGGGISISNSNPILENVTFWGNVADKGAGMYTYGNPVLNNVTFSENIANTSGGGIYNESSSPKITNSIFWNNTGGEIENFDETNPNISYSIVQGGYPGTGNLASNPLLGSLQNNGGFTQTMSLGANSSAIDGADDSVCPVTDQRGLVRPQGKHCDIGAYESDYTAPSVLSVTRAEDTNTAVTSALNVNFKVSFSEPVTGVNLDDFMLTTTWVSNPIITNVSGSSATYLVTVNTGTGNGTIRLDVVDDNTIHDDAGSSLGGIGMGDGNFTSGEEYTIVKSTTKPRIPILLSPTSGKLLSTFQPTLDWKDSIPNIHHYQLQVSTNKTFTALVINQTNIVTSTFTFMDNLIPGKRYYWRVRAFNILNSTRGWSKIWTFRMPLSKPTLATPSCGSALLTDRPAFDWPDVEGATKYLIQVSPTTSFGTLLLNVTVTPSEYKMSRDLPQNKTLYWRVRARTSVVSSPWSEKCSFTTGNPPTVPVLASPVNNALLKNYTPTLKWFISSVPSGTAFKRYDLLVDDNNDFSSPEIEFNTTDGLLTETSFTPPSTLAPNTRYYWRVRAVNLVGEDEHVSGWAVHSFRTVMLPPTLLSPADGSTEVTLKPLFDWEDVEGVTSYTIQISTSSSFSTFLVNTNKIVSTFTPTTSLPKNKTIYWRVRANGPNGPSDWSKFQFITPP